MRHRRTRKLLGALAVLLGIGACGWWYQSQIIGVGARWYLQRVAAAEQRSGDVTQRRELVARVHRLLLLAPPPEPLIPELYDFLTLLSQRVASGAVDWNWGAYLYTAELRDAVEQRPSGTPHRTVPELQSDLDRAVAFFSIQARPDQPGVRVGDLLGDDSYTVDEIESAHREGHDLGRTNGASGGR